jgi:tRNA(Ile)-lysidine synthase
MDFTTNRLVVTPGRYVVAVSGGIDSAVLLDLLKKYLGIEIVVAHFDHGIRDDSFKDAQFVQQLAESHGLVFETKREELGKGASEQLARDRRYAFLRSVAGKYNAKIITAHHSNDVVETIAINMTRGTGWRGLAVLDSDIVRPLLDITKSEIYHYASKHGINWREDSTNKSNVYLRNRIRQKTIDIDDDDVRQLLALRTQQRFLKQEVERELAELIGEGPEYSRYFFTQLDYSIVSEAIRFVTHARLTRPQMERAALAIKTAKPSAIYQAGDGVEFRFTSRNFIVELIK